MDPGDKLLLELSFTWEDVGASTDTSVTEDPGVLESLAAFWKWDLERGGLLQVEVHLQP